jgi:recombinational DNA repair protein RecT
MNALTLTQTALNAPADLKGVFEIEAFKNNFVNNYLKTTGKDNGSLIYEREKLLFMRALQQTKKLEKCSRFTIYSSFIELAVSGLSLNDGQTYIIPYGEVAQFQVGWKGRLEQIAQIPMVKFVNPPKLVYESEIDEDRFDYEEINGATVILKHKPNLKRPETDAIMFVYCTLDTTEGFKTYLMDRESVLSIRDRYSQPYRYYMDECAKQGKQPGETLTKKGQYGDYQVEPPFWITDEAQAFKKTLVKRVYGSIPKTARMKALDEKIATHYDHEDATGGAATENINYGIVSEDGSTQEVTSEPATTATPAATAQPATTRTTRKKDATPATPKPEAPQPAGAAQAETNPVDSLPDLNDI